MTKSPRSSTGAFDRAARARQILPRVVLRLYVAGSSQRSTRAIQNAKQICEENFKDRYQLEVIDIFQQPDRAREDRILAVPTLVRQRPAPRRQIIVDLSDRTVVLRGLDVETSR